MAGEPSYIELGVPDAEAARTFFVGLLGWQSTPVGGGAYVGTSTLDIGIHGSDTDAYFEVFFAVPGLETSLERLIELGGEQVGDIQHTQGFGRWVECRDPQGVRFGLRETGADQA